MEFIVEKKRWKRSSEKRWKRSKKLPFHPQSQFKETFPSAIDRSDAIRKRRSHPQSISATFFLLIVALASHNFTVIAAPNCNIPLHGDSSSASPQLACLQQCLGQGASETNSFVCDISADWMHHVGSSSDWYPATPPKGTGIHEYVAFRGVAPPCRVNGHCPGCAASALANDPAAQQVCAVQIDPEDCSIECNPPPDSSTTGDDEQAMEGSRSNSSTSTSVIILLCFGSVLVAIGYVIYQKKVQTTNPYRSVQMVQKP